MTDTPKIAGMAVYIEFARRGDSGLEPEMSQALFTSALIQPSTRELVAPYKIIRTMKAGDSRKQWRFRPTATSEMSGISIYRGGELLASDSNSAQTVFITSVIQEIANTIKSHQYGSWSLVGAPLFIEITQTDAEKLAIQSTPEALMRRLDRSRSEAGYQNEVTNNG